MAAPLAGSDSPRLSQWLAQPSRRVSSRTSPPPRSLQPEPFSWVTMLPQGLCICSSFCLECPPPHTFRALSSLRYYSNVSIFFPSTTLSPFRALSASQLRHLISLICLSGLRVFPYPHPHVNPMSRDFSMLCSVLCLAHIGTQCRFTE